MRKSKWARFTSSLPDDQLEEDGEIVRGGGLGVSELVADTLRSLGFQVRAPEECPNGWELYPVHGKLRMWMQITDTGDYFLLAVHDMKTFRSARRKVWFVEEVLVPLNEALRQNPAITSLQWINPDVGLESEGVYSPADPTIPEV